MVLRYVTKVWYEKRVNGKKKRVGTNKGQSVFFGEKLCPLIPRSTVLILLSKVLIFKYSRKFRVYRNPGTRSSTRDPARNPDLRNS